MTSIVNDFEIGFEVRTVDPRILLDAGPPSALYKVNPRNILGKEWWDKARKKAYSDFLNSCAACGKQWVRLEAHELYTVDKKIGKVYLRDIVPLCVDCHSYIHQDLHRVMLKKGKLKFEDVQRILLHGDTVLKKAHLSPRKRKRPNESSFDKNDWRLVLNGIEYALVFI